MLPAGVFGPATAVLDRALFTGVPQISGFTLVGGNDAIAFSASGSPGGGFGGAGPLTGELLVNVLGLLNVTVPLAAIGSPGAVATARTGTLNVSVFGAGWGTGPQRISNLLTANGAPFPLTVTYTGSDARTAAFAGWLTVVSPAVIRTNATGDIPYFAVMSLRFVPEPGALPLLGLSLGLLFAGRWRTQRGHGEGGPRPARRVELD